MLSPYNQVQLHFDKANITYKHSGELVMKWETPAYTDLRFGFEVTMYIYNR